MRKSPHATAGGRAAVLLLLIVGTVASTGQAIRATVAEQAARSSEQVAQKRKDEADEAKQLAEKRRGRAKRALNEERAALSITQKR